MFKQYFRIGSLRGLWRIAWQRFACLLSILLTSVRTCLAYVWSKRAPISRVGIKVLQFLKLLVELIKDIRTLLFCNQTDHFVQVAA